MISLGRQLSLANGVKAYQVELRHEPESELEIYKAGLELEGSLNDPDSLAHKVFTRLSSFSTREPKATEARETAHSEE